MKGISITNFLSALAASCILFSCAETVEEPQIPETDSEVSPKIQRIIDLANSEAERYFPSKSRSEARIAKASGIKTVCENSSRGENDTLIYVVNYENNNGFALISAVDADDPVLAVVPNGSYDPAVGTDNPGFNMFMEAAKYNASNAVIDTTLTIIPGGYPMTDDGKYVKQEDEVEIHFGPVKRIGAQHVWGQTGIYGQYCPEGITGCVPITIACIAAYLRYRNNLNNRIYYTFPGADVPYEDIEWIEIFRHHSSFAYHSDGSHIEHVCWAADKDAVHKSLGRICRQIGYDGNAQYFNGHSGYVNNDSISRLLRKYLPEFEVTEFADFGTFRTMNCIERGLVLITANTNYIPSYTHTWYTDGYEYKKIAHKTYISDPPLPDLGYMWVLQKTTYTEVCKNYMFWNWNGEYDGWFSESVLNPRKGTNEKYIDAKYIAVMEKK